MQIVDADLLIVAWSVRIPVKADHDADMRRQPSAAREYDQVTGASACWMCRCAVMIPKFAGMPYRTADVVYADIIRNVQACA